MRGGGGGGGYLVMQESRLACLVIHEHWRNPCVTCPGKHWQHYANVPRDRTEEEQLQLAKPACYTSAAALQLSGLRLYIRN